MERPLVLSSHEALVTHVVGHDDGLEAGLLQQRRDLAVAHGFGVEIQRESNANKRESVETIPF